MSPTREQQDFVDIRWNQLNALSKESAERAINFLMLTNSGGAIATLSFLGAVESIRQQWAPKVALFLFILGVILLGVHSALWLHHVVNLDQCWRRDATRFLKDELDWDTLTSDDEARAKSRTLPLYIVGYLSFACFILGAVIGLCFTHF
jgi:hypothetical protein